LIGVSFNWPVWTRQVLLTSWGVTFSLISALEIKAFFERPERDPGLGGQPNEKSENDRMWETAAVRVADVAESDG
jgi:hypothetical protein